MGQQGKSNGATGHKEALLSTCLGFRLKSLPKDVPYFAFDLNAGNGFNLLERSKVRGSAIVLYDKLQASGRNAYVFACEKVRKRHKQLCQRLITKPPLFDIQYVTTECLNVDNRLFLPRVPELITSKGVSNDAAEGMIVADPNGLDIPVRQIATVVESCARLDVWIHFSAAERVFGWRRKHATSPGDRFHPRNGLKSIDDIFAIHKKFWLITPRFGGGSGHWVMFGSHVYSPAFERGPLGLYPIRSPKGRDILNSLKFGRNGNGHGIS